MRFKLDTFRQFMKKQGYNWSEKDCTMYLKETIVAKVKISR